MNTVKVQYKVGWSYRQNNQHIRRTTNTFNSFNDAYAKYLLQSNRSNVIYCYLNERSEFADGSVSVRRIYELTSND